MDQAATIQRGLDHAVVVSRIIAKSVGRVRRAGAEVDPSNRSRSSHSFPLRGLNAFPAFMPSFARRFGLIVGTTNRYGSPWAEIAYTGKRSRSLQMGPKNSGVPPGVLCRCRQRAGRSHPLARFSQSLQKSLNRSGASAV